jgi:hypothetical protein
MDHEWHPGWHPILLAISWYQIPIFFSQVFTPGKPFGVEQHPGYVPIFLQQTHTQFTFKSSSFIKICRPIFKCITHICICIYICIYIYGVYVLLLSLHHSSVSHLQIFLENLHNCWRACGTCSSSCSMITESNSSAACSRLAWKLYCQCFLSWLSSGWINVCVCIVC